MSVSLCIIENVSVWIADQEDGYSVFWRVVLNFWSLSHIKFFSVFLILLTSNNRKDSNYFSFRSHPLNTVFLHGISYILKPVSP